MPGEILKENVRETEARLHLLQCPDCESKNVAVHEDRQTDHTEYACLTCGLCMKGQTYGKHVEKTRSHREAKRIKYEGTTQNPGEAYSETEQ